MRTFIQSIHSAIFSSFIHSAYGVAVIIWNCRTSSGNTWFDDNVFDMSCISPNLFDTRSVAVVVMVVKPMVAVLKAMQYMMAMEWRHWKLGRHEFAWRRQG